jgi:hypothetical protein
MCIVRHLLVAASFTIDAQRIQLLSLLSSLTVCPVPLDTEKLCDNDAADPSSGVPGRRTTPHDLAWSTTHTYGVVCDQRQLVHSFIQKRGHAADKHELTDT